MTEEQVGTAEMVEQKEVAETERGQRMPLSTSMVTSHDSNGPHGARAYQSKRRRATRYRRNQRPLVTSMHPHGRIGR